MHPEMYLQRPYYFRPSGYRIGCWLIALLIICASTITAYGVQQLTGLSFLTGCFAALVLRAIGVFFLRRRPIHERMLGNGWDQWASYAALTFFLVAFSAFGLYGLSGAVAPAEGLQSGNITSPSLPTPLPGEAKASQDGLSATPSFALVPSSAPTHESINLLGNFITDTFVQQTTAALGCWIMPGVLELFIALLLIYIRPRITQYPYMD